MTTAEILENITDPGQFERLLNSILRKQNPEYSSIISTGQNSHGKTIKSPHDGFCQVPGSNPPKFIMVQHTTVKTDDLEKKWLFDRAKSKGNKNTPDGDIIKSGNEANNLRESFSDAKFLLILSTNRALSLGKKKDDPLYIKALKKCKEFEIGCDVWEQSRICDYLDNTPEGHWLRKEFLGIEVELLSEIMLGTICKSNLEQYKRAYFLDDELIQRELDISIEQEIKGKNKGIYFLIGDSGFGKSTISYQLLKKHIESGGFGLWISAENLEEGLPLENTIAKVLKQFHSRIQIDSGDEIWKFSIYQQFYIVIDDINRSVDPTRIIQRIISFIPQKSTESKEHRVNIPFTIICPVLPKYWVPISQYFQNNHLIHPIQVGKFTLDEAESAIFAAFQKCDTQITRIQANQVAKNLGCDPLLIGLSSQLLGYDDVRISLLSNDVIDLFIQRNLNDLAQRSPSLYLSLEYSDVLSKICIEMLIQKQFFPTFSQIEEWLSDDPKYLQIFRELIRSRILCTVENGTLVFRHDRIRFYLLTQSLLKILESNSSSRSDIISELYYADLLGQVILLKEQTSTQLDEIQEKNILALFESLRIFGEPITDYHNKIIERIIVWIKEEKKKGFPCPSIIEDICWIVFDTDSSSVISITEYLPQYFPVQFARIRNGCVISGVRFCSNYNNFQPRTNFLLRDRIFEHTKEKHYQNILDELDNLLRSNKTTDKKRYGALIFAGFLNIPSFEKGILTCWNNAQDKRRILPAALWAGIMCCGDGLEETLNPMIDYWASLPNDYDSGSGNLPEILQISEDLEFSVTRKMTNRIVKYLISQSEQHQTLTWPILVVLNNVDDPDAIEYVVNKFALDYRGCALSLSISDRWNPKIFSYGRLLSSQSLDRLELLWKNDENNPDVRRKAFKLWRTGADFADIEKIKNVSPHSPIFKESVILRTELKDWSVLSDYVSLISQNIHYLYVAHHLWCDDIKNVVESFLNSFGEKIPKDFKEGHLGEHYALSSLMMAIPQEDAEQLLNKYWDRLKYSPLFIHSALYIGTQKCLNLAETAIKECPTDIDIFSHISGDFWVNDQGRTRRPTLARLNNLKPYLSRFSEIEIQFLYSTCENCGFMDWARENLGEYLSEVAKKRYLFSDSDLQQHLQQPESKKYLKFIITHWIEEDKLGTDTKEQLFHMGCRLVTDNPSQTNLEILSAILKICGTREDLKILDKFSYVGDNHEIFKIKQDTRFHVLRRTIE